MIKLMVVQKNLPDKYLIYKPRSDNKLYASVVGEFNLIFAGPFYKEKYPYFRKSDCFILSPIGAEIHHDQYGIPLLEININPLIRILKKDRWEIPSDKRLPAMIQMLEGISRYMTPSPGLVVLHYGY